MISLVRYIIPPAENLKTEWQQGRKTALFMEIENRKSNINEKDAQQLQETRQL